MNEKKQIKKQQLFCGMIFYSSLIEMEKELNEINYVIIKGEPLSMLAYGCYGNRSFHDIDILIDRKDVPAVNQMLNNHGFYQLKRELTRQERIYANQAHQTFSYLKDIARNTIVVDVNVDIFWGEYEGKRVNISDFINNPNKLNIYGFNAKVLRPMEALVALTLHHYKELNSLHQLARGEHPYKAKLFKDIYNLIENNNCISAKEFYDVCYDYEIIPYAYFVLYYTNKYIGSEVLSDYLTLFKTEEGVNLLECYGLTNRERKKWKISFEDRIKATNLFEIIREDLSQEDIHKIKLQKRIFNNSNERIEVINNGRKID